MKSFTLATLAGLVAVVLAAAVPEQASSLVKDATDDGIWITLCNDFHGGKPCQRKEVARGKCSMFPPQLLSSQKNLDRIR